MCNVKYVLPTVDLDTETERHRSGDNCWTAQTSAAVDNEQDKVRQDV
jgi:hypothetical protein